LFQPRFGSVPDFYVATTGSDANTCRTILSPCLTIAGAQTKLRAVLPGAGQARPWIVQVSGGTYELTAPLIFTAADSGGSVANNVTWQAAPGQTAVISGGRNLSSGWTDVGGIWEATHADLQRGTWNPRNFWVNDERRFRPRNPGFAGYLALDNYGVVGNAPANKLNQFVYAGTDVDAAMVNPTDAEVMSFAVWSAEHLRIAGINAGTKTITTTGWLSGNQTINHIYGTTPDSPTPGSRYFIENVFENLATQDGTFYVDRSYSSGTFLGKLKYNAQIGETINTMRMVAPVLDTIMFVTNANDGAATVNNITFKGLHFAHTDMRPPTNGAFGAQGGMQEPSAINVAGATNVIFDGVTIRNTGSIGITISYGCTSCQVINSDVYDTGGIGINVSKYIPGKTVGSVSLVENHGQNLIPNPSFIGLSSGNPGANWFPLPNPTNGISKTYATGQENGIPYIDITLTGTNTLGADFDQIVKVASPTPGAVTGEQLFVEGYLKLSAGTTAGIAYADFQVQELQGSTFLQTQTFAANMQKSAATLTSEAAGALNTRYMFVTMTVANANATNVAGTMRIRVLNGADFTANPVTIRFGGFRMRSRKWWPLALGSATGPQEITNVVLRNNKVLGVGRSNPAAAGITVNNASTATVENNHIEDTYGPGMELGFVIAGGSCNSGPPITYVPNPSPITSNMMIGRNFLKSVGQNVTSDLAAIYLANNSPGTKIFENVIQGVDGYIDTSPASGIYIDEDGSNIEIARNTVHTTTGPAFYHHFGVNLDIHDNIAVDPGLEILTDNWSGAVVSQNMLYRCAATNAGFSFYRNTALFTETAADFPRMYGNNNEFVDVGPVDFHDNRFEMGGQPANPLQYASWNQWSVTNGQDAGTVFGSLGLTGTAPFAYPANKPSGWVDWNQSAAGVTSGRTLPTPVPAFP
jgi:hypothetical protein